MHLFAAADVGRDVSRAVTAADGTEYRVRSARIGDFASWRAVRMANERRLAPAFGSAGRTWAEENTATSWVEWITALLRARRRREALPMVISEHRPGRDARIVGEIGVCGIDPTTRSGELYAWAAEVPPAVVPWAVAQLIAAAFAPPYRMDRVVAPIACGNPGPRQALEALGFTHRARRHELRDYDGAPTDHDIWAMENTTAVRASMDRAERRLEHV